MLYLGVERLANVDNLAGNVGIAFSLIIWVELSIEVTASRSPVASVNRVIHLHSKSSSVASLAILLDVVAYLYVLQVFACAVEEVGIHVDGACAIGYACRDATHGAVFVVVLTKVPESVLSIAGQRYSTGILCGLSCGGIGA